LDGLRQASDFIQPVAADVESKEAARIPRRGFLAGTAAALAVASTGFGGKAYAQKPKAPTSAREMELKAAEEAFNKLSSERQNEMLREIEGLFKNTPIARLAEGYIKGLGISIEVKPFDYKHYGKGGYAAGSLDEQSNELAIHELRPRRWLWKLRNGNSCYIVQKLHEATHRENEHYNPDEGLKNLVEQYEVFDLLKNGGEAKVSLGRKTDEQTGKVSLSANKFTGFCLHYAQETGQHKELIARIADPKKEYKLEEVGEMCKKVYHEVRGKLSEHRKKLGNGGVVLMEMNAHMMYHWLEPRLDVSVPYQGLTEEKFREDLGYWINLGDKGHPQKQLDSAYSAVTRLYALRTALSDSPHTLTGRIMIHHHVAVDTGKSLLSYDPVKGEYTEAEKRIGELTVQLEKKRGKEIGRDEVDAMASKWVSDMINEREKDQLTIKRITEEYLLRNYKNWGQETS